MVAFWSGQKKSYSAHSHNKDIFNKGYDIILLSKVSPTKFYQWNHASF